MNRLVRTTSELLFLACLLAVSLLFCGKTISTVYVKETAFRLLATLAIVTALPLLKRNEAYRLLRIGLPIFLFWLWLGLSVFHAEYRLAAASFAGHQVLFMSLGLITAVRSSEIRFASLVICLLVFLVAITSGYGLFQWFGLDFFEWGDFAWDLRSPRVPSSFGNPNFFAGFLVGALPVVLALGTVTQRNAVRVSLFLLAVVGMLCGFLTFSRAGIAGVLAAAGIYAVLAARGLAARRGRSTLPWKRWLALAVAVAVVLVIVLAVSPPGRAVLTRFHQVDVSASTRALVYKGTARMVGENPVFGVGADNFGAIFPAYRPKVLARLQPPSVLIFDRAHSEYLQVASELGFPGLLLFLWVLLLPIEAGRKSLLSRASILDSRRWFLASGVLAGYVGIMIQNLVSVNLRRTSTLLLFWTLWGLMIGITTGREKVLSRQFQMRSVLRGRRAALLIVALGLVFPLLAFNMKWYMGDSFAQRGRSAREFQDRENLLYSIEQGLELNPFRVDINYSAGSGYYSLGTSDPIRGREFIRKALDCYRQVEKLGGAFADVYLNQATCLLQLGEIDEAINTYEKGIELDPFHAKLHDYLSRAYLIKSRTMADQNRPQEAQGARRHAREAWERAREYYGPSVELDAINADLRLAYARFLSTMSREFIEDPRLLKQDLVVALKEVEEALRLSPHHPGAQSLRRQLLLLTTAPPPETEETDSDGS
jgi:O-antigen ligase